ncbi:Amidase signature domain, partial [Dillenia turbinata]
MLSTLQNPRLSLLHHHHHRFPLKGHRHLHITPSARASHPLPQPTATQSPPSTSPPPSSTILSIRHSLLSRRQTAVQLAESYLARIQQTEPHIRSFLHISNSVIKEAEELDRKIERNEELGPLAGVFVGVKDNICTANMPSTGGSKVLEGYRPPFDATAVRRVKECGGIIVGKTNLDEFGMGSTTEGSAFQVTANPWDVSRVPGGSSGGSAAAVSAGQCVVSLGSDTGGSVRQPASFCGVVGIKPTYGRVSRYGLMAYASSLDAIGCFGSSVVDTGILLHAISGHDQLDATTSKREVPDFTSQCTSASFFESKPLKGLRVGVIRETLDDGVDGAIKSSIYEAAAHLEELGCNVTEVSLPSFSLGLPAYYILALSESSSNLSRYDGIRYGNQIGADELNSLYGDSRAKGFGSEVKLRILMGTYALSAGYYDAYYKRAQQVRTLIQRSFKDALDKNDILISPAAPSTAYSIGMTYCLLLLVRRKNDPLAMSMSTLLGCLHWCCHVELLKGDPMASPVGLQIIGAAFDEAKLLKVGHIFEQTLQGH